MKRARPGLADRWWMLMPIALFVLAFQPGATATAAPAGTFPDFIPLTGATRGVAVDKVGNVFVSVSQGSGPGEHILIWKFTPYGGGPSFVADIGPGTIGGLWLRRTETSTSPWRPGSTGECGE